MWLKILLSDFQNIESISWPVVIYYENTAIVYFSQNNRSSTRLKSFWYKSYVC